MKKVKILIVDDEESLIDLLIDFLVGNGYEVEGCIDSTDAKNKFLEFKPDIVITDVIMPDIDGIELLLELRKINADIRIIVMSGGNRGHADTYLQMADKLGANTIIRKPFELTELLLEIKKIESSV